MYGYDPSDEIEELTETVARANRYIAGQKAEIERLEAVVEAARNVSVARPGTMAEALNEMINAIAALEVDDD